MKSILSIQANSEATKSPDKYQGWLKKLGGKLKIWKERYYVLTDTHLYYYTGTDRKKLLGEFCLDFAQIESDTGDLEYNGDKSCLLLLKINGSSSPQNNSNHNGHSQQQHQNQYQQVILCAPNARERKLWLRAIRKVLYLHYGGALFGTHLDEVFPYTRSDNEFLPRIVYETVQFIRENGLDAEGIFRKCGKQNSIQSLADLYDLACPGPILIPNEHDVHLVSGLLKYYLRELPEPVIPYKYYDKLKAAGYRIADGRELSDFINLFDNLPSPNYNLLKYLCEFLYEVSEHEKQNRMSIASLASMFAPNFLRQQDEDPYIEMSASQLINHTVTEFIKAYQVLFPHELKSPNWDKLNINNHNMHVLHNHKDLNTLPVDFTRIQTQMNSPVSRCKTTHDRNCVMGRSQNSFTQSVIYESPKNSPYHSLVNSSNNNSSINHYHHHHTTTTTVTTTTISNNNNNIKNNNNNNVITNPIDHIHQYNYNSILLNNAKSSHDNHTNNIYMKSPTRDHMDNNHQSATIEENNDANNGRKDSNNYDQKESRLQLRKLHTESGEYELGSLADGVSEENLHSISYKTDSTEHTINNAYKKEEEQRLDNVGHTKSNKTAMKSIKKCFNSLPEHRHGLDLTKKSVKTRPEIPLQWSSFHNDQKSSVEKSIIPTNTTAIHQTESNEARISFNLDDLSKIYLNSQKLANIQTPLSNTTITNTTTTTITDNNNDGITKATNGKMSKGSFSNGHKIDMNNYDALKKRISLKEFTDRKNSSKIIQSESFNTHSPMEQIRYWRSVAEMAQANAAGQLAKTEKLTQELARLRWDLSISHMENNLLRQNLASVQAELNHIRQIPKDITNYAQHNESMHRALYP
ncbi:unnamed protein product [Schistosoma rodhaini]|uniref:Rho-GAP domain-containing protein n=1 Tax=Schistosoma rodhaini TaxID=6188 RepID=A0AA85EPC4_9TREM|nr:unnamed protein product [Schistosoma rodhaini]CAH8681684.1 unnamed protein product [Schistosoma rodhaini]